MISAKGKIFPHFIPPGRGGGVPPPLRVWYRQQPFPPPPPTSSRFQQESAAEQQAQIMPNYGKIYLSAEICLNLKKKTLWATVNGRKYDNNIGYGRRRIFTFFTLRYN